MATLVCFHAHPDDEAIGTGGTIARAASLGHRVVLVVATGGEYGEVPEDLADGESLTDRRRDETLRSAEVLGISRVEFLGYSDSGMTGWDGNNRPEAFMNAPLDEAAARLASILRDEQADVLTTYDWHGGYGHPDHIAVHRVGHRAAELAGTPNVYENTMNRDEMDRFIKLARETAHTTGMDVSELGTEESPGTDDGNPFGTPEAELTTRVDVSAWVDRKRRSLQAHRSQVSDASFFMRIPEDAFATAFGTEWFVRKGAPSGVHEDWLSGL